jgi:hypothetical protein
MEWLEKRTRTRLPAIRARLTPASLEVLAADRADEIQELTWLALSAGLRRRQA